MDNSTEAADLAGSLEIDASVCRDDATENDSCSELESDEESSHMIGGLPRIKEAEEELEGQGLDEIELFDLDDDDEAMAKLRAGAEAVLAQLGGERKEERSSSTSATSGRRGPKIVKPLEQPREAPAPPVAPTSPEKGIRGGRKSISGKFERILFPKKFRETRAT